MSRACTGLKASLLEATMVVGAGAAGQAVAQDGPVFEVYGFAQVDYIQDFDRVDPDWEATLRPSKIPTTEGQFGDDGQSTFSVRQSRFGVQAAQEVGGQRLYARF